MIDSTDRDIIQATQAGLPLTPQPYHAVAAQLGLAPDDVMERMRRMQDSGIIRRIGAVPNHYKLGFTANGMSVWDVPDETNRGVGPLDRCFGRRQSLLPPPALSAGMAV